MALIPLKYIVVPLQVYEGIDSPNRGVEGRSTVEGSEEGFRRTQSEC